MKSNRKGQALTLNSLPQIMMLFAFIALVAVVVLEIITSAQADMDTSQVNASCATYGTHCNYSTEYLALENITKGMSNMTEKAPLLGTIIILAIIIAVVVGSFAFAMTR